MSGFRLFLIALLLAPLMALGAAVSAVAHGGVGYMYFFITPVRRPTPWMVIKDNPYAEWNAASTTAAGTDVVLDTRGGNVDSAYLVPQALYASDRDLAEGTHIWLPKGGLMVKMRGGPGNWYCTYRFDDRAGFTQADALTEKRKDFEYLMCIQADAEGHTSNAQIMNSGRFGLLTITIPDSGMLRYRNGIRDYNPVTLSPVDSDLLPKRMKTAVGAVSGGKAHPGAVCLAREITDIHDDVLFRGSATCFEGANDGVGQSVQLAGGTYTLVSRNPDGHYTIRIDKPLNAQDIAPQGAQ